MNALAVVPALLVVAAVSAPVPASAAAGPATAATCGWTGVTHPSGDSMVVVFDAPPIVVADGADPRSGRVRCSLQRGTRHSDPDAVAVTSLTTPGVVTLPPTPVEFADGQGWDLLHVCTSVEIDGAGAFYRDTETGEWSADPGAPCYGPIVGPEPWEPLGIVGAAIEQLVSPLLCGAGDVYAAGVLVWDCPPYENG